VEQNCHSATTGLADVESSIRLAIPMMDDVAELKTAIESMHGGSATFTLSVPVRETFDGKTV
jgi:hypothetical protein